MGVLFLNIKEKRWQEEMYNENEEIEKELTLSQYIDELDIPEEVLEDNVFGNRLRWIFWRIWRCASDIR